jgi:hypothetical protein
MNESTLLNHQAHWTEERKPTCAELIHLSPQEMKLYEALKNNTFGNNIRLEQEFINPDMIPFILPNIFLIADQSSNEEYVKYILPRLKIIFKLQKPVQV